MSDPDVDRPGTVEDLPPAAKLVYKVLEYEGELTHSEVVEKTMLPDSTARESTRRLLEIGAIDDRWHHTDLRQKVYSVEK